MSRTSQFAYVQARLQARHGMRPSEATWHGLSASVDLGHYLQSARGTSLSVWVEHLQPGTDIHEIERSLRADWTRYVGLVASWPPAAWRPAVNWTSALVYLPAVAHLLGGGSPAPWMLSEPALSALAREDEQSARVASLERTPLAPLSGALRAGLNTIEAWRDHWQSLWPKADTLTISGLSVLEARVVEHLAGARGGLPGGLRLREKLAADMTRLFRDYARTAVAVFSHLILTALDIERLRGGLVRRKLFPARGA